MLQKLNSFVHSRWYWLAIIVTGLAMESVALFYQHVLGEPPCELCIQARFWVFSGVFFGIIGLVFNKIFTINMVAQLGVMGSLIMLWNRSWISVLIERGIYEGQCGMDAGFPAWFALDEWIPQVFEVWTMCGYTPNLIFGLTMGEGLVLAAIVLLIVAVSALVMTLLTAFKIIR